MTAFGRPIQSGRLRMWIWADKMMQPVALCNLFDLTFVHTTEILRTPRTPSQRNKKRYAQRC